MSGVFLQRLGLLGGLIGGGGSEAPSYEIVSMMDFQYDQYAPITEIDGVALSEFAFISVRHNGISTNGAGSGVNYGMELSADGGTTWGTLKDISINSSNRDYYNRQNAQLHAGAYTWQVMQWIQDFNSEAPTHCQSNEMIPGSGGPRLHSYMSLVAEKHNAIRFKVSSSADSVTFGGGGSLELVGYRTPRVACQVFDFSTDPTGSLYVDIPAGHTIANVYAVNVGRSIKDRLRIQAANGGVPQDSSGIWRRYYTNASSFGVFDATNIDICPAQTSDGYGHGTFFNLNMAAPIHHTAEWHSVDPSFNTEIRFYHGTQKTTTAYSQLRIFINSGTINAGKLYVQTYNPATEILLAKDFGAASGTYVDLTDLTVNNATGLVWSSFNCSFNSTDFIRAQTMVDGVPDATSGDYNRHQMNQSNHSVSSSGSGFGLTPGSSLNPRGSALMVNLPLPMKSMMVRATDWSGSQPWIETNVSMHQEAKNGIRFKAFNSNTFNAGTLYAVGYKL